MRLRTTISTLALLVLLPAAVLAGCGDDEPDTAVEAFDDGGEAQVELVTGEPFEATGVVDDVIGERAFMLYDALVITAAPVDLAEDHRVRVTGAIESSDDVEREMGATLGDDVLDALADEDVVVVASEIEVIGRDAE